MVEGATKLKQGKKTKNVVIGSASYSLIARESKAIKVKITNGQVKKALKEGKTVKATLSGTGLTGTVKLKLVGKR